MASGFGFGFKFIALSLMAFMFSLPAQAVRAQDAEPAYSEAEIDQVLAPIALYPDVLLSQILMASTYPLELVQAARWRAANPDLDAEAALAATEGQDWDPSVKALVAFPRVLEHMDEDLEWTQRLGEAFLFQEDTVMARVQELRRHAWDAGALEPTSQARMVRADNLIIIEPASAGLIHVPYYDTRRIYGDWWWPAYPPSFWGPPRGMQLGVGFVWSSAVRVPSSWFFSTVHWPRRQVIIVPQYRPYRPHYRAPRDYYDGFRDAPAWRHDMRHRRGLVYRHEHWRNPARPPQIGAPRAPAVPQRPSILRDTPGGSERRTGPQAHQFGHSNPRLDSSDRQVPINPRAGERFRPPQAEDRGRASERRPAARPQAAPPRRESRDGGSRRSDSPRSIGGGDSSRGSGAAPRQQQRDSVLR